MESLNRELMHDGVTELTRRDRDLAGIVDRYGHPPMWRRSPGFATLAQIILEQQVSLTSARAVYLRLRARLGRVTAQGIETLGETGLRTLGVTRQKARYLVILARAVNDGNLDLRGLTTLDDGEARNRLTELKGIGLWTADVYLLMALGRLDIWPVGDLALAVAVKTIKGLKQRPSPELLEEVSLPWRPWRAVAARILWHFYLRR